MLGVHVRTLVKWEQEGKIQAIKTPSGQRRYDIESYTGKYVEPTSYADAMSRSDAKLWQETYDKEMNGLMARNVFSVVDRPLD